MRTINRVPFTVDKPKTDYKFFNHYNWKGINTNKNYFDIDQETFEDCKNVYMNEDGVLSSRPAVKLFTEHGLENIDDVWTFNNTTVYLVSNTLYFSITNSSTLYSYTSDDIVSPKLIDFDNKILIFSKTGAAYYFDITNPSNTINNIKLIAYEPETKIYVNGILSESSEEENLLTKNTVTTYLYNNISKIYNVTFTNKYVDISIDDNIYKNVQFVNGMENVLFSAKSKLSKENYSPADYLGEDTEHIPMITVQEYDDGHITLISSVTETINESNESVGYTHNIYYSLDDLTFNQLPYIDNFFNLPYLAETEKKAIVIKPDGVYAIDIVSNDPYSQHKTWYLFSTLSINSSYEGSSEGPAPNHTVIGHFINLSNFVCLYFDTTDEFKLVITGKNDSSNFTRENESVWLANRPGSINLVKFNMGIYLIGNLFAFNGGNLSIANIHTILSLSGVQDVNVHVAASIDTKVFDVFYSHSISSNDFADFVLSNVAIKSTNTKSTSDSQLTSYITYVGVNYLAYSNAISVAERTITISYVVSSNSIVQHVLHNDTTHFHTQDIINNYNIKVSLNSAITSNEYHYFSQVFNTTAKVQLGNKIFPLYVGSYIYAASCYKDTDDMFLYTTDLSNNTIKIKVRNEVDNNNAIVFDNIHKADELYLASKNILYFNDARYDDEGKLLLYLHKTQSHTFDDNITQLHTISSNQIAVFLNNEIYYTNKELLNDLLVRTISKSKLSIGCSKDSSVITSFDGKYILFPSERGLVAMGYQDFVASTDQTITNLSDAILNRFIDFCKDNCKLFIHKYWLMCYNVNGIYVFDFRNASWWYFDIKNTTKIFEKNQSIILLSDKELYKLEDSTTEYYDMILSEGLVKEQEIQWFIISQKLHLGTLNYTKQIVNMTFNALESGDEGYTSMKLQIKNYRLRTSETDDETLLYNVDVLRTYVKRLNYFKVNQFQYKLTNNDEEANPKPLLLDSIIIKYKISGQVK